MEFSLNETEIHWIQRICARSPVQFYWYNNISPPWNCWDRYPLYFRYFSNISRSILLHLIYTNYTKTLILLVDFRDVLNVLNININAFKKFQNILLLKVSSYLINYIQITIANQSATFQHNNLQDPDEIHLKNDCILRAYLHIFSGMETCWSVNPLKELQVSIIGQRNSVKLLYNHTELQAERQASAAAARSHWNALWRLKIGPRPIPKMSVTMDPMGSNLTLDARCGINSLAYRHCC